MPNLALVDVHEPQLTGPRRELQTASKRLAAARAELERLRGPESRLMAVAAEHAAAERELAELRQADAATLASWLAAGATTPRPAVSDATLATEQRVAGLARDAAAAQQALPEVQAHVQRAAEHAGSAGRAPGSAIYRTALEAAEQFVDERLKPALDEFLALGAIVKGFIAAV